MKPFLAALDERVLVCDGAMGTMLYSRGVFINRCFESLNQTLPALVVDVHGEYLRAGADVIETNTFGANRMKLRSFGLGDQVRELNLAGARLAREAVNKSRQDAYVAGAIGPLGVRIEPWGKTGVDEAEAMFRDQAQALLDGGVDLFVLETFRDLNEIGAAITAVRSICDLPIVAQMTTEENGASLDGAPAEEFATQLVAKGANVVGVNCSVGPAPMLETIERISDVTDVWLSAQPNAGKPRDIEGRNLYLCTPEYMASYARRFIAEGVRLVGGCCGTTPEHIRQIALAAKQMAPGMARHGAEMKAPVEVKTPVAKQPNAKPALPPEEKSFLGRKLVNGHFVRAIELVPPRGHVPQGAVDDAKKLAARGVDVVTIPDGPRSGARMSALALAVLVQQQAGIEALLQYSCRDRNLLGIQSDLLGAHAMGVRNVLGITGDVRSLGDIPDATAVFDVDSIGLTNVITRLNYGLDIGGQSIGEPTCFHTGVMVNPSRDLDQELRRLEFKVEAGAEFAVTRPVFDVAAFERFLARVSPMRLPIIVGIWPFESALHAEFMANEVPGVTVPDALVERMRRTANADAAVAEGVKVAKEIVGAVKGMAAGVQISTPAGRLDAALDVLGVV
ncbi:MAG TPA: bifunctional homocysteine S-methyltransferase/methylenetetrahydrofolate reductase [Vicinamibacterales bacterium]|nr:bifunctional homocysteine S-methyltransferase/methylenetetrahydrofolate reductase [Vicinamibacterales bacterium]